MESWAIVAIVLIGVLGYVLLRRGGYLTFKCRAGRQTIELCYQDRNKQETADRLTKSNRARDKK